MVCLGGAPETDVFFEIGSEPLFAGKVVEFPLERYPVGLAPPFTCRLFRVVGLGMEPVGDNVFFGRNPVVGTLVEFFEVGIP